MEENRKAELQLDRIESTIDRIESTINRIANYGFIAVECYECKTKLAVGYDIAGCSLLDRCPVCDWKFEE